MTTSFDGTISASELYERYRELQEYVGWSPGDAERISAVAPLLRPAFAELIDDFYAEIDRHPRARAVITGGEEQIARLKGSLRAWLEELVSGCYDSGYVERRWRVGHRHVEISLSQVYTNAALSRLRRGLMVALEQRWQGSLSELLTVRRTLNTLIDLDLAIIEDAYQTEYVARQQRVERLAAIGQIAGGIAHELRNPLNVVKTSIYYLLHARQPGPEKVAEHLRRIDRQVGLADNVITALSGFAKMPLPDLRPMSVEQCLKEAVENNPLPENVDLAWAIESALPPALGDRDQMRIVLGNLVRNARDAMPGGGRLTLTARSIDREIEVSVADTGAGMETAVLRRIMEPLYSTKARGLGLGLAISRAIVDKHGARLTVQSAPGQGATFSLLLRAATMNAEGNGT